MRARLVKNINEFDRKDDDLRNELQIGKYGVIDRLLQNKTDEEKDQALYDVFKEGDLSIVKVLYDAGILNVNGIEFILYGLDGMHISAKYGQLEVFKYLISIGGDIQEESAYGENSLLMASMYGQINILKYIYSQKLDTDIDKLLTDIAHYNQLKVIKYLVSIGGNINVNNDIVFRVSAAKGYDSIVKYCIENGANVSANNDEALRFAAKNSHATVTSSGDDFLSVIKLLIENGADIESKNNESIRNAAYNGRLDILKYLHTHGGDIHVDKDAVLEEALETVSVEVVKYLIDNGIDYSNFYRDGYVDSQMDKVINLLGIESQLKK